VAAAGRRQSGVDPAATRADCAGGALCTGAKAHIRPCGQVWLLLHYTLHVVQVVHIMSARVACNCQA
jgi:hypothetical protein